jgi:transcriptional regulator with XRE-family HTH domain
MVNRKRPLRTERDALALALERAGKEDGLSQMALARRLGSSQATISKIIAGTHAPRPALASTIRAFLGKRWPAYGIGSEEWMALVKRTAEQSDAFANLLISALSLTNKNE